MSTRLASNRRAGFSRCTASMAAAALVVAAVSSRAQSRPASDPPGVSGYVLTPDGVPVSEGTVVVLPLGQSSTPIDRTGRFHLVPETTAPILRLAIRVPGFPPFRLDVTAPASRRMRLPVVTLNPASYFRARFVSTLGEPIPPRLRRLHVDENGIPVIEPPDQRATEVVDADGTLTVGPLPLGKTMLALDAPPFARTRLQDLLVGGVGATLDAGTVVIQPGATLHVDVVDGAGAPVPTHEVILADSAPLSPLPDERTATDHTGRAVFRSLASGRYRLGARGTGRCGGRPLWVERVVTVPGSGSVGTRLIVGGTARFRITSPLGPLAGIELFAAPDSGIPGLPPAEALALGMVRPGSAIPIGTTTSCGGRTDADGRVTIDHIPPGLTRLDVRLANSLFTRRLGVPEDGHEMAVVLGDRLLPVHVTRAGTNQAVTGAIVAWTAGNARLEGRTTGSGDALLDGVSASAGTLEVTAAGLQQVTQAMPEPPTMPHEVRMEPEPLTMLSPRVVTASGRPIADAVVLLAAENPMLRALVAPTDATGVARFVSVPLGPLRATASASGYAAAVTRVVDDDRGEIVIVLSSGFRVVATVELPSDAGPQLVRVVTEKGVAIESLLDSASDRVVEPGGRVSLGPLAPGTYTIELHGAGERRQTRVRIDDRDVAVTLR